MPTKTKNILLIEDDPFLIDIYTTKLKQVKFNFNVDVAEDGAKALKKIKEKMPDLIILDIVLPHMDGWDLLKNIKKDKSFEETKVIILSNLGQKEEVEKGIKLGAKKYFVKAHYTPSQIVEEINKLFIK